MIKKFEFNFQNMINYKSILLIFIFCFVGNNIFAQQFTASEIAKWNNISKKVNITRDIWGIPHIKGGTDAEAVFGLMYAQCEDDFQRIELNYIEKLGRLSEINGDRSLYNDLQIKLLISETDAKADYKNTAPWMKKLLDAYSDGLNFYLFKNPTVKTKLLKRFEPWYPLLWTDGSIGAISTEDLTISELRAFYGNEKKVGNKPKVINEDYEQTGSNGFAIAPKLSKSGNAMLYINPHTTFYFRPEIHIQSNEGLNAYGAVTWGQFFVYQGFNESCGWMHTSSNADVADLYIEEIINKEGKLSYLFDGKYRPIIIKNFNIKIKTADGFTNKSFKTYFTHHGPIMAERDGKWLSLKSYNRAALSLEQSWVRTKAKGFDDYKKAMYMKANTSNNTVYADKGGNIAYWHGNYMPIRNKNLEWWKPVDGTKKENEYQGLHMVDETVHSYNPINGWLQNCNSTPFTVAGENSPKKSEYPSYMAPDGENFRGVNAVRLLSQAENLDLDGLIRLGYNKSLPAFEILIPRLLKALENNNDSAAEEVKEVLKNWKYEASKESIATTLAVEWAQKLNAEIRKNYINPDEKDQVESTKLFVANCTDKELLDPLKEVISTLNKNYGTWKMAWGDINRFQRLNGNTNTEFDDKAESIAVGSASALWGCLPSFNSRYQNGSLKRYGFSGNSFICAVEFGERVKAKSLLAGGNSGDVNSKSFNNQGKMYAEGEFKDVLYYDEDIKKNAVRTYRPGE